MNILNKSQEVEYQQYIPENGLIIRNVCQEFMPISYVHLVDRYL